MSVYACRLLAKSAAIAGPRAAKLLGSKRGPAAAVRMAHKP